MSDLPGNKLEMFDAMKHSWTRLNSTLATISDEMADRLADVNGWTIKDHVVNITAWERSMILLQHRPRYEGLGIPRDVYLSDNVGTINETIRALNEDRTWTAVRAELADNHEKLMSILNTLSWDQFHLPYSHYLPDEPGDETGEPILRWVIDNTSRHFELHRAWIEEIMK